MVLFGVLIRQRKGCDLVFLATFQVLLYGLFQDSDQESEVPRRDVELYIDENILTQKVNDEIIIGLLWVLVWFQFVLDLSELCRHNELFAFGDGHFRGVQGNAALHAWGAGRQTDDPSRP